MTLMESIQTEKKTRKPRMKRTNGIRKNQNNFFCGSRKSICSHEVTEGLTMANVSYDAKDKTGTITLWFNSDRLHFRIVPSEEY